MNYSKEDIQRLRDDNESEREITINNKVFKFVNLILDHLNSYNNQFTLTMYSFDLKNYQYREEILNRLKKIFPSMEITTQYENKDAEYYHITFNWN